MKSKEIQELIQFLSETGLEEISVKTEEIKLRIKRSPSLQHPSPAPPVITALPESPSTPPPSVPKTEVTATKTNHITIHSPMIGTFYRSSTPESSPFIEIGSTIKPGDTLCVIEAMKLFNEIEAEVSGKIVEILVENAEPVEYDQPLFTVEPL